MAGIKELTPEDRLVHKIETLQKQLAMALSEYHAEKAAGSGDDGDKPFIPIFVSSTGKRTDLSKKGG